MNSSILKISSTNSRLDISSLSATPPMRNASEQSFLRYEEKALSTDEGGFQGFLFVKLPQSNKISLLFHNRSQVLVKPGKALLDVFSSGRYMIGLIQD